MVGLEGGPNTYAYAFANPSGGIDPTGLVDQNWFAPTGNAFYSWGQFYSPIDEYTILGHGAPGQFCGGALCGTPGAQDISASMLAKTIYSDPNYWPGRTVRLIACQTGVGANSYAQQLANELGKLASLAGQDTSGTVYGADGFVVTPTFLIIPLPPVVYNGGSSFGSFVPFKYQGAIAQ